MLDIDYVLYKINTTINFTIDYISNLFIEKKKTHDGYTIISKNNIKYLSYEELWEDSD
jgi:DNA integrity scanning protein DisA with diadenylate cyclase activity